MPACLVITDAPTTLGADDSASWVQIAKTGRFKDPRYGTFSITGADFAKWIENFNALHRADGREGLPIDIDHAPEKRGETQAAGWITKLEARGDELWALAEWNSLGRELVSDRRYVYLSPSYQHDYKDETGKQHGTALVGVALTNRPFLTMATVSLSRALEAVAASAVEVEADPDPAPSDSPAVPTLLEKIAEALGLSKDADEATVLSEMTRRLAAPASGGGDSKTLTALAAEQGCVVLSVQDHNTLTAQAAAGAQAAEQLREQRFEQAFDKALSEGKTVPAMKEHFAAFYGAKPDEAIKALEEAPVVLSVEPVGATGDRGGSGVELAAHKADAEGSPVDEDSAKLDAKARELMAANPTLGYGDAVDQAVGLLGGVL